MKNTTENIEIVARLTYDTYCEAVGGKAFNGDPLPDSTEFFNDPAKEKQANGYRKAAEKVILLTSVKAGYQEAQLIVAAQKLNAASANPQPLVVPEQHIKALLSYVD